MKTVLRHLRRAALLHAGDGLTDSQLLDAFVSQREETAFEVLLRRHGPMVLGVCRRVLRNIHDAEDAFQATFLVLARKAGSLRSRELLGNWLYGVAYRTAMKAQAMNAKRRSREREAGEIPRAESFQDEELLAQLDYELNRLPDKYRVPIVLCELEGRTRKDVARVLGVPEGTLSWRLARAKKLLGRRLSRFGTVAVTALLVEGAASASLSPILRSSTVKTALTTGAVPAKILALTEGVIKSMFLNKLRITACSAVLMLFAGVGASGLTYRATAQQPAQRAVGESRSQTDEPESLRLEIEALRKSLQATRERVKTLEDEVRTMQRVEKNPPNKMQGGTMGMMQGAMRGMSRGGRSSTGQPGKNTPPSPAATAPGVSGTTSPIGVGVIAGSIAPTDTPPASRVDSSPQRPNITLPPGTSLITLPPGTSLANPSEPDYPLPHAEEALRRLRENPNDTKAVEALERALKELKQLKEQKTQKPPAE